LLPSVKLFLLIRVNSRDSRLRILWLFDDDRRIASGDAVRRYVARYDGTCADHRAVADGDAFEDDAVGSDEDIVADGDGLGGAVVAAAGAAADFGVERVEVMVEDADVAADVAVSANLHAGTRGDDDRGCAGVVSNPDSAALPSVEYHGPGEADSVAAPVGEQADVIADGDAARRARLDAERAGRAEALAQRATLQAATQIRAQRGPSHVGVDEQHVIDRVGFVKNAAHFQVKLKLKAEIKKLKYKMRVSA